MAGKANPNRAQNTLIYIAICIVIVVGILIVFGVPGPLIFIAVLIAIFSFIGPLIKALIGDAGERRAFKKLKSSNLHGTAKWATEEDIRNAGYAGNVGGLFLGTRFYFADQGHLLTVGGARSGKGNQVIQTLLDDAYEGSTIVLDPKGEIAAVTAAYQKSLGRDVHILDPWDIQNSIGAEHGIIPAHFNPLSILDPTDENLPDDCDMLAEMLVPINPKKEDHWSVSARQWISGYLLHMMTSFDLDTQNLGTLRGLFRMLLDSEDEAEDTTLNLLLEMKHADNMFSDILKENANEMMNLWTNSEKEATGINSSAKTATDIFKSVGLKKSLANSSFDIKDITQGNTTLYICIPAERLETHGVYLRLIVGSVIRTVQRYRNKRVLMIMDEFYSLGYMKSIANSMGQMPGYNLQLWPIIQDLNQLRDAYGEQAWETFIANAAVRMFMGIDDQYTAEYVSKQLGTKTDAVYNDQSESMGNYVARSLLNPAEVRQSNDIITFTKKTNPIKIKKIKYWENPDLSQKASRNPYVEE